MKENSVLRWTLRTIKPWIPALIVLVLCNVASALFGVWFALGTKDLIDTATQAQPQLFYEACIRLGLLILAIILNSILMHHLRDRLSAIIDRDLKKKMLTGLLQGDFSKISKYHTGDLLSMMNHDLATLISSIMTILPSVSSMFTKLFAALTALIAIEPKIAYVVLLAGIVVVIVTGLVRRNLKTLNKRASQAQGKVSGFIQETLEKLLMVQAMDISDVMEDRANTLLQDRYEILRRRKNISLISSTCLTVLAFGSSFGAMVFCASGIIQGTITFGTLTAVNQLINQIRTPITNMSGIAPQYAALSAAAERLMELDSISEIDARERKDATTLYDQMTTIEARELTFAYDRDYVFDHASFLIPKGSFGVIVGHSGIGKSTLLKLLLGIFPAESGGLYLNTDSESVQLDRTTRKLFAYVPQGNLLLSGTLRDNLTVTNRNATQEEIDRAIYISAMDAYLPSLPEGLDTVVGENALGLSEGQAQRLSIARAILSNAPIMLLDEATSALDDATEKAVLSRIRELPGKTCIAVTHREAATQIADWSLEMQGGKCTLHYK